MDHLWTSRVLGSDLPAPCISETCEPQSLPGPVAPVLVDLVI